MKHDIDELARLVQLLERVSALIAKSVEALSGSTLTQFERARAELWPKLWAELHGGNGAAKGQRRRKQTKLRATQRGPSKLRGQRVPRWQPQEVRTLRRLAKERTPAREIASELGRTEIAVRQKALSLRLSLRTTGAGRKKREAATTAVRDRSFGQPTRQASEEEQRFEHAAQQYERIVSEAGNRIVPRFSNSGGQESAT